ncbi:MAG: ribosome maturation factor RimM [Cyanobacteria bacterium]|nr:ribosome maturation factor RimM [Cyanobacteriota bacterium]
MADPASPQPAAAPGVTTATPPELLVVGRLVGAQGLGGELRVLPLSDFPERFTRRGPRWLQAKGRPAQPVELRSGRQLPGKELFVVRLGGIDSRDAAEALVGHELLVPAADRPPLEPGEFHLLDLVGLEVRLLAEGRPPGASGTPAGANGAPAGASAGSEAHKGQQTVDSGTASLDTEGGADAVIGRVLDLIHAGNDLLEVELCAATPGEAGRRLLIPFVEAIVPVVNLAEGWIGITPPPGLLEL